MAELKNEGYGVLIETSARHCHVTREVLDILYGKDYQLTPKHPLSQPGQYASQEKVTVVAPKEGKNMSLSILGPCRPYNQVEISATDARSMGFPIFIRQSGELSGTPGTTLIGPKGSVVLKEGVIVVRRHIHMIPEEAEAIGLKDGDIVAVKVPTSDRRALIFGDVVMRVTKTAGRAMHIDTDESNAALVPTGAIGEIIK